MTSIDFKKLLQEAKAQALAGKVEDVTKQHTDTAVSSTNHAVKTTINNAHKYSSIVCPTSSYKLTEKYEVGKEKISKVSYIPNYITEQEEKALLQCVSITYIFLNYLNIFWAIPNFQIYSYDDKWVQLKKRRLQNWGKYWISHLICTVINLNHLIFRRWIRHCQRSWTRRVTALV